MVQTKVLKKILFFLFKGSFLLVAAVMPCLSQAIEVAITVDDLPGNSSVATEKWLRIQKQMLAAFQKHKIQGVYGFANAKVLSAVPILNEVLKSWVEAGHFLGNHTYSHVDLNQVKESDYIEEIKKNEAALKPFMTQQMGKYFRFPYLTEGNTLQKRNKIRKFLKTSGYTDAPVTLHFRDYAWLAPYERCLNTTNLKGIEKLQKTYLERALLGLEEAQLLSQLLLKREMKYVLLIHIGSIQGDVLDSLLSAYESKGVKFISLASALKDPIYRINPDIATDQSYPFLNQVQASRKVPNTPRLAEIYQFDPEKEFSLLCNEFK